MSQEPVARGLRSGGVTYFRSLSSAGFAATAISFGPARMGFGLFVPEFREAFGLSSSAVGAVSSLAFLGYFVGLLAAQYLLARRGPEAPVLSGLVAASVGMALVAVAPGIWVLAAGVTLSGMSAGFAWTPFNDAVHRKIREFDRPVALSEISSGTGIGIALAGAAALALVLTGLGWRVLWGAFAALGLVALALNWVALREVEAPSEDPHAVSPWILVRSSAAPLYAVAFVFGTVSAIYISFVSDRVSQSDLGALPGAAAPALVFILYGWFGLAGLATGWAKSRLGLAWLLRLLLGGGAVSLAVLAVWPSTIAGLVVSAGVQGIFVLMTSAVLAFWAEELFPSLPSSSFTAALLVSAVGSVAGPVLAGLVVGWAGAGVMFLGLAVLPLALAVILRDGWAQEYPIDG